MFPILVSYVWGAIIRMRPKNLLWCDGIDALEHGVASCQWRLCSAITVARSTPSATLNEAALLRYLAEAPWYPFVLVPGRYGVTSWVSESPTEATATIVTPEGVRAACTFEFDKHAHIVGVRAVRGMLQPDGTLKMVRTARHLRRKRVLHLSHHAASVECTVLELRKV